MYDGRGVAGRFLRDSELNYLRYGLRLDAQAELKKRALQTLCEYYEAGRRIAEPSELRQMIHSHLGASEPVIRRWSMKALALIGHPDDFPRIVDRLRVENDMEAQTWGVAALVKNARDLGLTELCKSAGLSKSSSLQLAARLYARSTWLETNAEPISISLDDDDLTLKWAIFLIGYDQAPENLFDSRHSNEIFLGELNTHGSADISEYSIWALWERKDFGARYSRIPLTNAARHPESVRKWLYRLATKSPVQVAFDPDALGDLRRDPSGRAREGLALGVVNLDPCSFASEVLEWYTIETSGQVRENLLASMAARSTECDDYADAVIRRFRLEQADSTMRRRLLAASEGTPLYADLKRIDIVAERDRQGLLLYGDAPYLVVQGDLNVTGPTLQVGGNLNAQNVAVGNMINSANAAVQQLERSDHGTAEILCEVLRMLVQSKVEQGRAEIAAAVERVAKTPSVENKRGLIDALKAYGAGAAAMGTAVSGLDKLVQVAGKLFS